MDARKLLLVAVAVVAIALVAPAGASAKVLWLCKPGMHANPCEPSLTTTVFSPAGKRLGVQHVQPAKLAAGGLLLRLPDGLGPARPQATQVVDDVLRSIVLQQTARYSRDCRVFAPGLPAGHDPGPLNRSSVTPADARQGYADVREAWRTYLRQVQPRPRRGPRQPLAGQLRPAEADRRGGGREPGGPETHALRDPARRERHREEGQRSRRRLQARPRLPVAEPAELRDRLLDLQRDAAGEQLFGRTKTPGLEVLCTNPARARRRRRRSCRRSTPTKPFAASVIGAEANLALSTVPHPKTPWASVPNAVPPAARTPAARTCSA